MVSFSLTTPILLLISTWLSRAAPTPPPSAASFYVDLATLPNFHRSSTLPALHVWSGHLLAEVDNFIPPGPNETPHPNLDVQAHLFFVLVKARRAADRERTIFWFNGGPGCSSFDGLMMEVGPWRFDENGELWEAEGGWEEYANVVYLDQPIGTGFSYGSTDKYLDELSDVPKYVLEFMRNFYKVFPELANTDTYLAGESYAGQYIPYIADALLKPSANVPAPLKGIAIGNGWIDAKTQYPAYVEFGLKAGLYTQGSEDHKFAEEAMAKCTDYYTRIAPGANPPGIHICEQVMHAVTASRAKEVNGVRMCLNGYDIRLMDTWPQCGMNWPPDLEQITPWLRKNSVVKALHATAKDTAWTECSGRVGSHMHNHRSESSVQFLPAIAEKIPIMLFAGDQDVICNYVGQERLLEKLTWNGHTGMGGAETLPWTVNGTDAGTWQTARNMTYVKIFNASHMVGFDLPHVAHDMMLRFMNVDFGRINEGTVGKIDSSVGDDQKEPMLPGGGKLSDLELKAKWEAYYNAGTVALIVVLIAVTIGTILYCHSRRRASRVALNSSRGAYTNGDMEEESIPLNPSAINGETPEESRRRKGKGRVTAEERAEEENMFEIGSDGEEKYPSNRQ